MLILKNLTIKFTVHKMSDNEGKDVVDQYARIAVGSAVGLGVSLVVCNPVGVVLGATGYVTAVTKMITTHLKQRKEHN